MKKKGIIQRVVVVLAMILGSATLSVGLSGTAQAATCVNPVGVTPALDLTANGSNIGYLYLGYFSSCRKAYAELHITNAAVARVVRSAEVWIRNTVTGATFGDNTTLNVSTNGGWADSIFIPIDENNEQDMAWDGPTTSITAATRSGTAGPAKRGTAVTLRSIG
jgi:hypothetical protein